MKLSWPRCALILQVLAGVVCTVDSLYVESRAWATLNAFLAGLNISGAYYNWLILRRQGWADRMMQAYDELYAAFDQMRGINDALVQYRVILNSKEIEADNDDDNGTRPSLH